MYCKHCNSLIDDNTTVCPNCGRTDLFDNILRCPYCGNSAGYRQIKKIKFNAIDWLIIIAFFPLSIIYSIAIKDSRTVFIEKCAHCNHIKE